MASQTSGRPRQGSDVPTFNTNNVSAADAASVLREAEANLDFLSKAISRLKVHQVDAQREGSTGSANKYAKSARALSELKRQLKLAKSTGEKAKVNVKVSKVKAAFQAE